MLALALVALGALSACSVNPAGAADSLASTHASSSHVSNANPASTFTFSINCAVLNGWMFFCVPLYKECQGTRKGQYISHKTFCESNEAASGLSSDSGLSSFAALRMTKPGSG